MNQNQKDVLDLVYSELLSLKSEMPNGELSSLIKDVRAMKKDISELKVVLLNPEDGLIVKTNKNTEFMNQELDRRPTIDKKIAQVEELVQWKSAVNKALWIIFTVLAGILSSEFFNILLANQH